MSFRNLSIFLILIWSGLTLAACSKPVDNNAPSVEIKDGQMLLETTDPNSLDPNSASSDSLNSESVSASNNFVLGEQTESNQNQPIPAQKGPAMKTLQDFTPVAATKATLHTSKGDITFELFRDQAPLTTINFLTLAKDGFYDGVVFHRVIEDFMAQVGDPKSKDPALQAEWGTGGPGYTIADEFDPALKHDAAGIVSMANAGPNTGGSQFFITFGPTEWLDGKHAVFGKVTAGMDVVNSLITDNRRHHPIN